MIRYPFGTKEIRKWTSVKTEVLSVCRKSSAMLGFFIFLCYNVLCDAKCWNVEKWNEEYLRS